MPKYHFSISKQNITFSFKVGEMGVGKMGAGERRVGKMGVGKMGIYVL